MSNVCLNIILESRDALESSKISYHVEQTHKPLHEKIDSEASKKARDDGVQSSSVMILHFLSHGWYWKTILEAFSSPNADDWKEVSWSDMDSIISSRTWELVEKPYGCKFLKRSLGLMVQLKSISLHLWLRVISKRKMKLSLILIYLSPDWSWFEYHYLYLPHMVFSFISGR